MLANKRMIIQLVILAISLAVSYDAVTRPDVVFALQRTRIVVCEASHVKGDYQLPVKKHPELTALEVWHGLDRSCCGKAVLSY